MKKYCAGIDLGTTNTVLAVWRQGKARPEIVPIRQPIDDRTFEPRKLLDSVVTLLDGRVWVGAAARNLALLRGAQAFTSIKRYMGRHWFRTHEGIGWTPERVSACILKVIHEQLLREFGGPPERLVVTIPATFGMEARRATLAAAQLAGFAASTISLFDEPTAALLAELQEHGKSGQGDLHVVIDIGGGTLDVSLVRLSQTDDRILFDIIGQSRYNEIAGDDFDLNIAGLLLHRFELHFEPLQFKRGDPERTMLMWSLLQHARDVKHRLSDILADQPVSRWPSLHESVTIAELPELPPWRTDVSGNDLCQALSEFFSPVADSDSPGEIRFFRPIRECLATASAHEGKELTPAHVSHVWMAGGSATLPPVKMALEDIFRRPPRLMREPMLVVATGAAWKAGLDAHYGDGRFEVRERLFDGVFLKIGNADYYPLVPVRQEVPMGTVSHRDIIAMPQHDSRLVLELYSGATAVDGDATAELSPLARRVVTFPEILPAGTKISMDVKLGAGRQLSFELTADVGHRVRGEVAVGTAPGWSEMGTGAALPPINLPGDVP